MNKNLRNIPVKPCKYCSNPVTRLNPVCPKCGAENPFPSESNEKKQSSWMGWLIGIFFLLLIVSISSYESETELAEVKQKNNKDLSPTHDILQKHKYPESKTEIQVKITDLPPNLYKIVRTRDVSCKAMTHFLSHYTSEELRNLPTIIKKEYCIVVPTTISKEGFIDIMKDIVKNKTSLDPDLDLIVVFAYDKNKNLDNGFTFGKMVWKPDDGNDVVTPVIASSNDRSSYKHFIEINESVGRLPQIQTILSPQEVEIYNALLKVLWLDPNSDEKKSKLKLAGGFGVSVWELDQIYDKVSKYITEMRCGYGLTEEKL